MVERIVDKLPLDYAGIDFINFAIWYRKVPYK